MKNTGVVTMDSRKFLAAINESMQSRAASMEQRVKALGRQAGVNWKLVSLNGDSLFIEDTDTNSYYSASYRREKGGNVVIENIRPLRIIESKKRSLFESSCRQLVDAVERNDQRGMASAFSKMAAQRFSSRTVPVSGVVRTRDNVTRLVNLSSESIVDEGVRPRLVAAIVEGLTNKVTIREGRPVSGTFVDRKISLPVSEWMCKKAVARRMRRVAEDAYWSPGFQDRVHEVAGLIYENKVEEAVKSVASFLAEYQEFTTLNRDQTKRLVENTLATRACFNQRLCDDTATLFWRTNLKVNRDSIIKEWRTTARKASHPTLLENVTILEQSPNFEAAYDKFIGLVFNEAVGPRDVQVHAYRAALKALKDTTKIKESNELAGKIDELIERLDQPEQDHAVIAEVEDLLAEVKNELNALEALDNFDQIPGDSIGGNSAGGLGDDSGDDALGGLGTTGGKGGTTVNFNININGDGVSTNGGDADETFDDMLGGGDEEEGEEDLDDLLGGGGDDEDDEEDLDDLLGGGGDEEEEDDEEDELSALLRGESRGNDRDPINENDPYSRGGRRVPFTGIGSDYGTKPIDIAEDCHRAVETMMRIADHNEISGTALLERAEELAAAGLKASGLVIPERRRDEAVEQLCDAFFDELDRRGIALDEDQYKGPWRHVWGRKKAAINRRERKGTKSESRMRRRPVSENCVPGDENCDIPAGGMNRKPSRGSTGKFGKPSGKMPRKQGRVPRVEWVEEQSDAKLGYFGDIGFIFDHAAGQQEPVIMSEDGQVEVPIPEQLHNSAFAAAEMAAGDPGPFLGWLSHNIEQLRPISEDEEDDLDHSINEATVRISTNAEGGVDIEVDSKDPNVSVIDPIDGDLDGDPMGGDPMGGDLDVPGDIGPIDGDAAPGMEPVEPIPPTGDDMGGEMDDPNAMPDFEGDMDASGDMGPMDDESGSPFGGDDGDSDDDSDSDSDYGSDSDSDSDDDSDSDSDYGSDSDSDSDDDSDSDSDDAPSKPKKKPTPPKKSDSKPPKKKTKPKDDVAEDRDFTTPQTRKYNTTRDDHRQNVPVPKAGKSGNSLDGFGDGAGSTPGVNMKKVKPRKKKG